ncbi:ribonuclease P protein component [Albidovulum sediminicola]|uniref:Ribonuclease P protein component n=1 Tax=Albidovulum sediminicola TaxID=2984331 RepID=A0ABT2Z4B9_9RHOB|nr:ribonuclease P protein component [Defluviimonas sp. WL0075]MCV2865968.1 ribonuclease P protein component [Defluviimonas sp. WL0075]
MMPPVAPVDGQGPETVTPPAVSVCLEVLAKRADFLRAAQARRQGTPAFLLQARRRRPEEPGGTAIRVGFTCSKKVGNAVARNRAKRRLREAARLILPQHGRAGWDYVLVGRRDDTANRDFQLLLGDLVRALAQVHGKDR